MTTYSSAGSGAMLIHESGKSLAGQRLDFVFIDHQKQEPLRQLHQPNPQAYVGRLPVVDSRSERLALAQDHLTHLLTCQQTLIDRN